MKCRSVVRRSALLVAVSLLALSLTACGAKKASTAASSTTPKTKVGFIMVEPLNGSGWSVAWDKGRQDLEKNLNVQTTTVGPVPETADVLPVYEDLIRQGYKVIVGEAFGYQPFAAQEAAKHPDVKFIDIGPNTQTHQDNVATVYGNLWEVRYATGVAAGLMTKTNQIGFVAAHTIPSVVAGINGFALGAQSVNPKATVKITVTNNWYDPVAETQAAQALIHDGADVTAQHEDDTATLTASAQANVWSIGSETDSHQVAPDWYLTGTTYDWGPYLTDQVRQIQDGTWKATDYSGDIASGLVGIGELNPKMPADVAAKVNQVIAGLKSGQIKVFTGPIYSNTGQLEVPAGTTWSTADIYSKTNFFVKGVDGKVSQ